MWVLGQHAVDVSSRDSILDKGFAPEGVTTHPGQFLVTEGLHPTVSLAE